MNPTATIAAPVSCYTPDTPTPSVAFHLSINVNDLQRSIDFYRTFFGVAPAKIFDDYAKFELADPPVVLSLEPQPHGAGGSLNHLGLRLQSSAALVEIQHRLETSGIPSIREEGVECCYAKQTKFWVNDPDGNHWEIYVLENDVDCRGAGKAPDHPASQPPPMPTTGDSQAGIVWEHHLGGDFPSAIPVENDRADRISLNGTLNVPRSTAEANRILSEAHRALRPGGKLLLHGLVADQTLGAAPLALPGPAAAVRHVPTQSEILAAVQSANFRSVTLTRLSPTPVFHHDGVPLRELMMEATKRDPSPFDLLQEVEYKGPFREVIDDAGTVYPRGKRIAVRGSSAELLREGPMAQFFVFFPPGD